MEKYKPIHIFMEETNYSIGYLNYGWNIFMIFLSCFGIIINLFFGLIYLRRIYIINKSKKQNKLNVSLLEKILCIVSLVETFISIGWLINSLFMYRIYNQKEKKISQCKILGIFEAFFYLFDWMILSFSLYQIKQMVMNALNLLKPYILMPLIFFAGISLLFVIFCLIFDIAGTSPMLTCFIDISRIRDGNNSIIKNIIFWIFFISPIILFGFGFYQIYIMIKSNNYKNVEQSKKFFMKYFAYILIYIIMAFLMITLYLINYIYGTKEPGKGMKIYIQIVTILSCSTPLFVGIFRLIKTNLIYKLKCIKNNNNELYSNLVDIKSNKTNIKDFNEIEQDLLEKSVIRFYIGISFVLGKSKYSNIEEEKNIDNMDNIDKYEINNINKDNNDNKENNYINKEIIENNFNDIEKDKENIKEKENTIKINEENNSNKNDKDNEKDNIINKKDKNENKDLIKEDLQNEKKDEDNINNKNNDEMNEEKEKNKEMIEEKETEIIKGIEEEKKENETTVENIKNDSNNIDSNINNNIIDNKNNINEENKNKEKKKEEDNLISLKVNNDKDNQLDNIKISDNAIINIENIENEDNIEDSNIIFSSKSNLNLSNEIKKYYITKKEILKDFDLSLNEDLVVLNQGNIDIKITEYCPDLFKKLRKNDNISEDYLIKVLQPKNSNTNLIETFNKNSFYINSTNKEFLIKEISLDELNFYRSNIITNIYQYLKINKNSLILRMQGIYDISDEDSSNNKIKYYALMHNTYECLNKTEDLNISFSRKNNNIEKINNKKGIKTYKLKQSKFNKCLYNNSSQEEKAAKYSVNYGNIKNIKQNNDDSYKIYLDEKEYNRLKNITKKDTKFLKKIGVLNYQYLIAEIPMDINYINNIFSKDPSGEKKISNEILNIKKYLFKSNNKKNIIYSISIVDYYKDPIKI